MIGCSSIGLVVQSLHSQTRKSVGSSRCDSRRATTSAVSASNCYRWPVMYPHDSSASARRFSSHSPLPCPRPGVVSRGGSFLSSESVESVIGWWCFGVGGLWVWLGDRHGGSPLDCAFHRTLVVHRKASGWYSRCYLSLDGGRYPFRRCSARLAGSSVGLLERGVFVQ